MPMQYPLRFLAKFSPLDKAKLTPNAILEYCYEHLLYGDRRVYELPEEPSLHILTTNISNGGLSVFNRDGLFIQERTTSQQPSFKHIPGQMASIPRVVGASSAFPGFFPPVQITAADLGVRDGQFSTEWFTDGGVYDNLGLRAFSWLKHANVNFDQILVSDAGKPFQILSEASLGFVGQSVRASDILWDRVWQLERQNFGEQTGFVFLPITEFVSPDSNRAALHPVVQAEVQSIRTDLDRFSDLEVDALVRHGYEVASKICGASDHDHHDETWSPIEREPAEGVAALQRSAPTATALQLRKSSRRRVWSTLFDYRDWPSYVYAAIALVLFVYCPFQIYELYRHSQLQATVIESIANGDPDIRQILDLVHVDPSEGWSGDPVSERPTASQLAYDGLELLTYSRIIDLRNWRPHASSKQRRGHVYVRDRVAVKLLDSYQGDRQITFAMPLPTEDVEFRQSESQITGVVNKVTTPVDDYGEKRILFEFDYDFSRVPRGESVTLYLEGLLKSHRVMSRAPFIPRIKMDLLTVWMLFPSHQPYRNYSLVRYPADRSSPPEVMNSRYSIDHPYGSLIGWSVVNAEPGMVYECRWTTD